VIVYTKNGTWSICLHWGLMVGCFYRAEVWVVCLGPLSAEWMPNVD